jgi:NAD(P)-dependent dehydrogenase (short-subunit alcohol dehydrogenase family)
MNNKGNVLITGSSSGLGFHLAKLYINDGYNVFINGSSPSKLNKAKKTLSTDGMVCNVVNERDCRALIKNCEKSIGGIDILVCNVGSGTSVKTGTESLKEWKRVFDLNLFSTINTVDAFVKNTKSKKTSIICISSICGHEFIPGAPVTYSVAKAALNVYVKNYSKHLVHKNFYLNGIVCGNILFDGSSWDKKLKSKKFSKKEVLKDVPVSMFASPQDIYQAAKFLSCKDSSFICGSLVMVDGGQTRSL